MISKLQKLPDKTLELTINVPWKDIQVSFEKVMESVVSNAELPGFRKGKAPRKLVEEKVEKNKVYSQVLEEILPKFYSEAIKEQDIKPIVNPKVSIVSTDENKDWVFKAQTCERPEAKLGDYKKELAGESAKSKIWVPGKNEPKDDKAKPEETRNQKLNRVIEILLKTVKIDLPEILIEDEMNRILSQTLEEIKKLGLTLDQYLASTGKTIDQLRQEAKEKALGSLKMEFILEAVAEAEKITVEAPEIEKTISENPDKNAQEALRKNGYLLAQVIRRQKTLDWLTSL